MANVQKVDLVNIDLNTGNIHRSFFSHAIGLKDNQGDGFGIRVFRDGEPVNLTGVSIQGVFMPPQGSPIAITTGNVVDYNEAYVVLPQACYNYEGQFTLAIKLVDPSNSVTGTIRIVDGIVSNTHASGTVAPTSAVPSYQEVLSTYEQAIAAINKTVRFDATQSLTDTQKATARSNISAPSVAEMNTAVGNEATARQNADALKVNISDIENDLIGTTAGKVLDARQGKVLDDKITEEAADRAAADADLKSALNYNDYLIPESFSTTYTLSAAIKAEDGTNGTTGFRTGYIDYTKPMKISFNRPGETFVVWAYSNSSTSAAVKISPTKSYIGGTVYLPLLTTDIKRFRIGFHKDNGNTYTEEEAAASFAAVEFRSLTDKTLLLENVPADAKVTGEKTTANRNDIDDILLRMGRQNWFNPNDSDVVEGQYISGVSSGSEVWTENANYGETGFIPVQYGDKITFFYAGATAVSSPYKVYYNSAKEPISGSGSMPDNKYVTISDQSIKYIRIAFTIARKDSLMVVKLTDQDATPYSPAGEVYVPYPNLTLPYIIKSTDEKIAKDETGGQWNGKTWYAYGTSITANNGASGRLTYVNYLAEMSGMTAVNKGLGGKGIGTWAGDHEGKVYDAICNITDGKLNADIITLETGANDIKNDGTTPLGTIYDNGRDSLSGCLNDCLRYLQENTTAQIVVMTSPVSLQKSITEENHQYYTWADMVEEICRLNRVHFINSDNNMGYAKLNSAQGSLYVRDSIHQTDLGSYIMAQNIWYQLRNIPLFYTAIPT